MTMVACAAVAAAPMLVGAQAAATSPTTAAPGICDCPVGDKRGDLRGLAAFAPLGLLGALAAAGGTPGLFSTRTPETPASTIGDAPASLNGSEVRFSDPGRNTVSEPVPPHTPDVGRVPEPVSLDSLRGGLRAPNTGTSLPAVFLLGTGLVAVGCVTLLRARS